MKKKYLLLFTDYYPFGNWEPYLRPEMKFLASHFEKIFIFSSHRGTGTPFYSIPHNAEAFFISPEHSFLEKLGSLRFFGSSIFWNELRFVRKHYRLSVSFSIIKIALLSLSLSNRYKTRIQDFIRERNLPYGDVIIYSYWLDYRAIAGALLSRKYHCMAISRAHGWDVYFERHEIPYLPYRGFLTSALSRIFFVSENGKNYFLTKTGLLPSEKLKVARLAIHSTGLNPLNPEPVLTIVSCARLVPLKRVHLIADVLCNIAGVLVKWTHFGSGDYEKEFLEDVRKKLDGKDNISFDFRGDVSHDELLKFYHENPVDLFMLTSEYEGMPFVIIEALSFGIPVMATNVGGISEVITPKNGFLLEKDFDPVQAAHLIMTFASLTPEQKLAYRKGAHESWERMFNAEENYNTFIEGFRHEDPLRRI